GSYTSSGTFTVPTGVSQVEIEVWGGGSGSYASTPTYASGGGAGGGYARKRVTGLVTGQTISVTVGPGGTGGTTTGGGPSAGGTSSFGTYVSATGGNLNILATMQDPRNGATPGGFGVGGDVDLTGSAGQAAMLNQGGLG